MSPLIQPVYSTHRPNAPITLGHSRIAITCNGQQIYCDAEVSLRLQPRLQLIIIGDLSGQPAAGGRLASATEHVTLQYGNYSDTLKALVLRPTVSQAISGATEAELLPNPQRLTICSDRRKRLKAVIFHVMNFPLFRCMGQEATDLIYQNALGGRQSLGRIELVDTDWYIELQELPDAASIVKELSAEGGYGITHVGQLMRRDGCSFAISAGERALRELHLLLSFARGLWTPVILPVGFDMAGNRVFEEWGIHFSTPWESRFSWFDEHHGQSLAMLYAGFRDLLRDAELGKPVLDSLYWYLRSNRAGEGAGVDSGIILSQAALERLALAYLAKAGLSTSGSAAERIRRAYRHLRLPTAIPRFVPRVYGPRRKGVWSDAPDALTKVRNELVHSQARLGIALGKIIPDTWQLSQWYVELCILRLSGYDGVYSNRLRARWRGQVEKVPWAR